MAGMVVDLTKSSPLSSPDLERKRAKAILHTAIYSAQKSRLRETLQYMCDSSADAAQSAESFLLVRNEEATVKMVDKENKPQEPGEEEEEEEEEESESDTEGQDSEDSTSGHSTHDAQKSNRVIAPTGSSQKRLRPKYATCDNCDEEFDVTTNGKRSCVWHPEEREADYDADIWADHDENCHGRISDLEDEFPEGFIYTCCNRAGDADGCRIGTHVEKVVVSKRMKF